jgi:adenylate cyclase
MVTWNQAYADKLRERFAVITTGLDARINAIAAGQVVPALDALPIGSGRWVNGSVLFFDISGFSARTGSAELADLKKTVYMLDCVIPMVMRVVFDLDGHVEKNTGDGIMAIFGIGAANGGAFDATRSAMMSRWTLENIVNPHLAAKGIEPVHGRWTIDNGTFILARIGTQTGTAAHDRNFLTAVGPTANIASKLLAVADPWDITIGDSVRNGLPETWQAWTTDVTPADWTWVYSQSRERYRIWDFTGVMKAPE